LNALGKHLLLELKNCNQEVLNDVDFLKACLCDTAEQIGAAVVNEAFHQFAPHGISGVVLISESHICIHTWPEYNYAAVDVFTCGDSIEPEQVVEIFTKKLGAKDPSFIEVKRGILESDRVSCELK